MVKEEVLSPSHGKQLQENEVAGKHLIPQPTPENEDGDADSSIYKKVDESGRMIETFKDDMLIPSPILKQSALVTFFGCEPSSALQFLGAKYNDLIKKHQAHIETKAIECENLRNKCATECKPKYENLKAKYAQECEERKHLYNELIEIKGNIRVFCRCRPLSSEEIAKGCTSILDSEASQGTELQIIAADSSRKKFKFDHYFGPMDNQESVFAETSPLVRSAMDGFDVCIFAYGQTGTGKTFTMEGTFEDRGVNYRALEELFRIAGERSSVKKYSFFVSMLEVYNEKIRDLLADNSHHNTKLEVKQLADGTQDVPGLIESQTNSTDELWELLKSGARNRSVGSTNANELSSRSHCLVRVTIKAEDLVNRQRNRSCLWLVDLAGSERAAKIDVDGERLKESQFINKSLSALGDVISSLASKSPHIPYRNSKLTHLLQCSLGGDCKTLMFAQISPSSADLGETLCTLNFATRVRGVEYGPTRKQSDPVESFKLKQMADKLRQEEKETARLNDSLRRIHLKYASRDNVFKSLQDKIREAEQSRRNYQHKITELESQLAELKKSRSQGEGRDTMSRPPLAPIKERPPLKRIANRLAPPAPRRHSVVCKPTTIDKENSSYINREAMNESSGMVSLKAQRILVSPSGRNNPIQPRRRASFAVMPHGEAHSKFFGSRIPRRNSVMPFAPLAMTPQSKSSFSNTGKYFSPTQWQASKSRIPTFNSPRRRQRLVSSPGSSNMMHAKGFSVKKGVIIGSPAQWRPSMLSKLSHAANQIVINKEMVGKFHAQRVLVSNRRRSVI